SVGASPVGTPKEHVMEAAQRLLASDPASRASYENGKTETIAPEIRALSVAAESFVFADGTAIVAGYPWLDVWSRDTLMALSVIYLVRGEEERAKRSIRHLLRNQTEGFLTSRTTAPEDERRPCVDASLWLFPTAHAVMNQCRTDEDFCSDVYSVLVSLFRRIVGGDRTIAWLSAEGLLVNGAEFPLTWMDATYADRVFTPRRGLAVEFQALWVKACDILAREAKVRGDMGLAGEARHRAQQAQEAFAKTFWCQETNHPFDCLSEHRDSADAWADPSIRPNALIALSVCPQLFESWQARELIAR